MTEADQMALIAPSDWAFHFETGRPCLDFVATLGDRAHLAFDRWRTPADLARWCVEAGMLKMAPALGSQHLKQACTLREAIYRIVDAIRAGRLPKQGDIKELNECAVRPALVPQLDRGGRVVQWTFNDPVDAILSTIARDAIALVSGADLDRIRKCASSSCSVLFLDTSRPGQRRWCSMNRCGNRMKKTIYRQRLRKKA
jgi:predicted RNA-binding Zn ribbon-like protein